MEEALRRVEDTAVAEEVATALDANASAPTLHAVNLLMKRSANLLKALEIISNDSNLESFYHPRRMLSRNCGNRMGTFQMAR